MAVVPQNTVTLSVPDTDYQPFAYAVGDAVLDSMPEFNPWPGVQGTLLLIQRLYDTTAGWVQYTEATFNPAPDSQDTTPNHTNNLVAASHAVIGEI